MVNNEYICVRLKDGFLPKQKRGDENELKRKLRLEKVVSSNQLRLAVETEEDRRAKPENDAATKQLLLAMETDEERKARLEKMVATTQLRLARRQRKKEEKKKGMDLIQKHSFFKE